MSYVRRRRRRRRKEHLPETTATGTRETWEENNLNEGEPNTNRVHLQDHNYCSSLLDGHGQGDRRFLPTGHTIMSSRLYILHHPGSLLDMVDLLVVYVLLAINIHDITANQYIWIRKQVMKLLEPKQPQRSFFNPFRFKFVRRAWDYIVLNRYHISDADMEGMPTNLSIFSRALVFTCRTIDNLPVWALLILMGISAGVFIMARSVRLHGEHAIFWKLLYGVDYPGYPPKSPLRW